MMTGLTSRAPPPYKRRAGWSWSWTLSSSLVPAVRSIGTSTVLVQYRALANPGKHTCLGLPPRLATTPGPRHAEHEEEAPIAEGTG